MNTFIASAFGLLSLAFTAALSAATPDSGVLSLESGPLEYSAGPFTALNPTPSLDSLVGEPQCLEPLQPCDEFTLNIELPEDFNALYPTAIIQITLDWDDPNGSGAQDYDFYLYDADGRRVTDASTNQRPEVLTHLPVAGLESVRILAVPYTAVGSSYTGLIELFLEDPFLDEDEDEEFRSASLSQAAGAGDVVLLWLSAMLWRRRKAQTIAN